MSLDFKRTRTLKLILCAENKIRVLFSHFENGQKHTKMHSGLLEAYLRACSLKIFPHSMEHRLDDGRIHPDGAGELFAGERPSVLPENLCDLDALRLGQFRDASIE